MIRCLPLLSLCALALCAQSPEQFFSSAGAGFRGTGEDQQLYWTPHIERSHARILEAARAAPRNEIAIVLGAGVCSEIPLRELATRFDRVILVDLDGPSMVAAVEPLPREVRGKVELRITDVTTFVGALMESIEEAVDESDSAEAAFAAFGSIFPGLEAGVQPLPLPQADLVVSSLVLSELPRYPVGYADRLVRARFGRRAREWSGYEAARARLERLIVEDHWRTVASLCREDGVVYFSDTVARGPAYTHFPAELRGRVEQAVAPELERLGVSADALGRLCHATTDENVTRETQAFEALLEAYEEAGANTFETLLPMDLVREQWSRNRLSPIGDPAEWFWLEYPCAIVHSPGGFRVRSWIFRHSGSGE